MTRTLDSLSDLLLEFLRSSGKTTRQNLALLVEELFEEFAILIINVLDAEFLETAILLLLYINRYRIEVTEFSSLIVFLCHCLLLLVFVCKFRTTLLGVLDSVLVLLES